MKKIVHTLANLIRICMSLVNKYLRKIEEFLLSILKFCFGYLSPIKQLLAPALRLLKSVSRLILILVVMIIPVVVVTLIIGKWYQQSDRDEDRGAIPITMETMGESYSTPVYVDQGWSAADSLWFYNTTQGSNLMPYDIFVELELADKTAKFISPNNIDSLRYLPQKPTRFNPDGLPVGFVKDTYKNRDYVGLTCAACHTGQVNYKGKAIRIDGGPAAADMDQFLSKLQQSMEVTRSDPEKKRRLVTNVLARNSITRGLLGGEGYSSAKDVERDLDEWTNRISIYNLLNHSDVPYGFARLDAFGRIYNRVLEHVLNKEQVANRAAFILQPDGRRILTDDQIRLVLEEANDVVIGQKGFESIVTRLMSKKPGFPGLDAKSVIYISKAMFNPADAPVSYPFLWDVAQSDYVQWNGLASNAGIGPLGRNTGEVIGVFGTLDWRYEDRRWWDRFSLSGWISGQEVKPKAIDFDSSIDKTNLTRLELHLKNLVSPKWEDVQFADGSGLPKVDATSGRYKRGRQLYSQYCQSCHELIERESWERRIVGKMLAIDKVGTDPKMADNSVNYTGSAGNFKHIYQDTGVGPVIVEGEAPVVQILTAATRGVIGTPDADKWWIRRVADWFYTLFASISQNDIDLSVNSGDYEPDTTTNPYASLRSYKARSLNGIWATAPYLHNGSVPTLYDLLLPKKRKNDPDSGEYRPDEFGVGCRELDSERVGINCPTSKGQLFRTEMLGNSNAGHEYAAGRTAPLGAQKPLPELGPEDRWALVEFLKTL